MVTAAAVVAVLGRGEERRVARGPRRAGRQAEGDRGAGVGDRVAELVLDLDGEGTDAGRGATVWLPETVVVKASLLAELRHHGEAVGGARWQPSR